VELADNFRSVPDIVADGGLLVQQVVHKQTKRVRATITPVPGDHGLRLYEYRPLIASEEEPNPEQIAPLLKPLILAQYYEAATWPHRSKDILLVMTRNNAMRKAIRSVLPKLKGLSVKTYHRAKGLEADIAFMVGDCEQGDSHPFRNAAYDASGRFSGYTYEQAQEDEAYRLAYVGVTRGKRRTLW
jgi:ATP-dependent exoDNAse (exonuclease V) beta subunit